MKYGYVALVLHSHLPFVKNTDTPNPIEESWLFEAMHESYIPLLLMLNRLSEDKIPFKLTMSFSPTLMTMLEDEYLNERFEARLKALIKLNEKELERNRLNSSLFDLNVFYRERFNEELEYYYKCDKRLLTAFKKLYEAGYLELVTTCATHAFLPLMSVSQESIKAQIHTGIETFENYFGFRPKGFWLPECGYNYNIDYFLKNEGIKYFLSEHTGVLNASPKPIYGTFAPIGTPNGVAVFPRDADSSTQVWSNTEGYPGDFNYREFYRDIGQELPVEYIQECLFDFDTRLDTGLKYNKITNKTEFKDTYNRGEALNTAKSHSSHFAQMRKAQIELLLPNMDVPPIIVCPYDTELFGHWWFEGPEFLEAFIRNASSLGKSFRLTTPSEYLKVNSALQCSTPNPSSWGDKADFSTWLNPSTQWIYIDLYRCEVEFQEILENNALFTALQERLLKQAARELMLAQASDWPFMISRNTTVAFAVEKITKHLDDFRKLLNGVRHNMVDENWLKILEKSHNIFPNIDYEQYKKDA